ncbi:MAG: LuxR C-terminal-related transcriptional regulator [Anaerolineaceae bacterium]|nr:LuxR C-terminal-related transcriptional regulator [Anaerolineaceae bacterium]
MSLNLSVEDITALEARTEGWIAGLQLAALSMQGQQDSASFIQSFTGSHHFVLDYLIEDVLLQQSENIQTFLLRTSILDRLCGPLCDAVLGSPSASGQETLEYLERANLFIVPLDNERRWYRYHHLFGELLRQRLHQSVSSGNEVGGEAEYHFSASQWYEDNGLFLKAFQHASAGNDIDRTERLMEREGMPLHMHYVVTTILDWLASLPKSVMDAKPLLWVRYASMALVTTQTSGVEERLQSAEAAIAGILRGSEPDNMTRDLIGQIAAARATLALFQFQAETMLVQSRRAMKYLLPDNLSFCFTAIWTQGVAYYFQGNYTAAERSFTEALSISQKSGIKFHMSLASNSLGQIQEKENQLYLAAESYRRVLQLSGDYPLPSASEAYLGLARICYEWNELDAAEEHGQQSLRLAQQYDREIDRYIFSEVFLARLKLARGDVVGATALLAEVEQSARQKNFVNRIPEIAAAQVLVLLRNGNLTAAAHLVQKYQLPVSQARVNLAQGAPPAALAVLKPLRREIEAKGLVDELLKIMVLQAVALHSNREKDQAVQLLGEALALAEMGGFIRLFVDEGVPMAQLLLEAASQGVMPDYIGKLLVVFEAEKRKNEDKPDLPHAKLLIEQLSQRELEVLQLIAQGLSNREISDRLFLALSTIKGHNRIIFIKLQAQNRTEAVARARELGLL